MTDLIDQAGQATADITRALEQLRITVAAIERNCVVQTNSHGVLSDHGMLLAELDQPIREARRIQAMITQTQWPTTADWLEV